MDIWFLEDVNVFKMLCPHRFKAYKKAHSFSIFNKKDYIYFETDAASKVYLIEKGKVKIGYYNENGDEVVKAILQQGELFGEKALLGENTRNEFAQSIVNNTAICPMNVDTLQDLMRENRTFSVKIYKFIGLKFQKLERRLQILLFKDTRTRLLEFLEELRDDYGYECPETGNQVIKHPYTQKDMASLIGTSRSTLNILLNELKAEKMLDFNRKEIVLLKK
ncbi:Crp/Fnr family transcriptional regulator [Sinomicrobium weinanense]|uniref:Crp/Fnr family transcriptional regulator n=1 Tax=Sinomicrobium weinanense TaxID=2842200 RepID=A0A926JNG4_9FLAO|nr:Crp/Fnr family transcriptional regulator [Sinomicrobium weinanense]MBC9794449.1 Crp/Fnr family transcriptional regulator [Sinomicrobium weinanense]MBU3124356.1 Crp/Fnr family transcriptional regulator [Sinomicrobium weinanense]